MMFLDWEYIFRKDKYKTQRTLRKRKGKILRIFKNNFACSNLELLSDSRG